MSKTEYVEKQVDLGYLKDFTKGDKPSILKYIRMFLASAPSLITDMEKALQTNDPAALYSALHTIKPQLKFMGISEGFKRAEHLEAQVRNNNLISPEGKKDVEALCTDLHLALDELEALKNEFL